MAYALKRPGGPKNHGGCGFFVPFSGGFVENWVVSPTKTGLLMAEYGLRLGY